MKAVFSRLHSYGGLISVT